MRFVAGVAEGMAKLRELWDSLLKGSRSISEGRLGGNFVFRTFLSSLETLFVHVLVYELWLSLVHMDLGSRLFCNHSHMY
jgi:hypothetical protein